MSAAAAAEDELKRVLAVIHENRFKAVATVLLAISAERRSQEAKLYADVKADVQAATQVVEKGPAPLVLTPEERLAYRQKQVEKGKNTAGYKNYRASVSKCRRTKDCPRTPDVNRKCSKRSFDGQIRAWRRALHQYDDVVDDNV
jgi:hypothetical protein